MLNATIGSNQGLSGSQYAQPGMLRPTEPSKLSQVEQGHQSCEKSLDSLHGLIATLEQRIQPVLRIEPATANDDKAYPMPPPQTVFDRLNQQANSIQSACNRVQEILRLLEL